jgi:SAM-dependent methyltransferase
MSQKKRKQKTARESRKIRKKETALETTRRQIREHWNSYASNWSKHADQFSRDQHYEWMSGFLTNNQRVLEIGTGDGTGTLAIHRNTPTVVSIDHNPGCQDIAEEKLIAAGVTVKRERRSTVDIHGQSIRLKYSPPRSSVSDGEVLLIEGDIGNDDELALEEWLISLPKFDAVVCWNIGTYTVLHNSYGTPEEYRLRTQRVTYRLADRILRPGGIVHIIDRGPVALNKALGIDIEEALLEVHRAQASGTSLIVDASGIASRSFQLPLDESGIVMKFEDETGAVSPVTGEVAFWSVILRKP